MRQMRQRVSASKFGNRNTITPIFLSRRLVLRLVYERWFLARPCLYWPSTSSFTEKLLHDLVLTNGSDQPDIQRVRRKASLASRLQSR